MKWERVTIFISSTFNDMHAERDYLVKDVFPELREWCEARKIHLVDVDLRWGVTEADSSSNHTVLACLNNIDESRHRVLQPCKASDYPKFHRYFVPCLIEVLLTVPKEHKKYLK
jgi:hypothetical protein